MRRILVSLVALFVAYHGAIVFAADFAPKRRDLFLALVKERHLPPIDKATWAKHVSPDAVWVGRGLRVQRRMEVEGMQMDVAKSVEIEDFELHDYGDAAVLSYVVVEHLEQGKDTKTLRLRKLDTYVLRDRRWQLVANAEIVGKPDRKAMKIDGAALDRYVGTYETMLQGKPVRTRIWREGAHLFAQTAGQEKGELLPLGPDVFFDAAEPQEGGPENVFVTGADGRVTGWIYREAGVEFPARRLPD